MQPRANTRRRGIVYGINWLDPASGTIELAYVGKTRQRLRSREAQHRDDQPWSDLIVGDAYVLAEGPWTDAELDAVEEEFIKERRPPFNYEHNLDNPHRVPIPVARRQRWERDDEAGRPRWVKPDERAEQANRLHRPVGGTLVEGRSRLWWVTAAAWAGGWFLLAVMLWHAAAGLSVTGRWWTAALTPGLALAVETWRGPQLRRWLAPRVRQWLARLGRRIRRWLK